MHLFYLSDSFYSVCSVFLIFKYSETLSFLLIHSLLMYLSQCDFDSLIMNSFSSPSVLFVDFLTVLLFFFLYTCFFLLSYLFSCHFSFRKLFALYNISSSLICFLTF